jgi:hypothetical protein
MHKTIARRTDWTNILVPSEYALHALQAACHVMEIIGITLHVEFGSLRETKTSERTVNVTRNQNIDAPGRPKPRIKEHSTTDASGAIEPTELPAQEKGN